MRSPCRLLFATFALCAMPYLLQAQTTGEIRGVVVDANGSALPGATVEASSPSLQGTRVIVAGAGGTFQLPALAPGSYRLVFSMPGFSKVEKQAQVRPWAAR